MDVVAQNVDFGKLWEGDPIASGAERVDLLIAAGGLVRKLVAGEIQDFQAVLLMQLVKVLELIILGRETAAGGCVHDQQHLAIVIRQGDLAAVLRRDVVIINTHK